MQVSLRRPGRPEVRRHYELARDPFLTPTLASVVLRASVAETLGAERDEALRLAGRFHLADGRVLSFSSASGPGPQTRELQLGADLAQRLAQLVRPPMALPEVTSVDVTVSSTEPDAVWLVRGAMPDRLTARPGDTVRVFVDLKGSRGGERRETVSLTIPADLPAGSCQLLVGAESTLAGEFGSLEEARRRTAKTADEYLAAITEAAADDRLQVALVRVAEGMISEGREYPALPATAHLLMRSRPGGAEIYRARLIPQVSVTVPLDRTIVEAARVSLEILPPESSR
jgi:hypothetical protein